MKGQKYIGKIYEGRWKVDRLELYNEGSRSGSGKYVLVNIYNGEERSIKDTTLRRVDRGEINLSWVFARKIKQLKRKERRYGRNEWNQDY